MGDHDHHLNFLSAHFDAYLALTTPGVQAPIPNARPLDNLYRCRCLLPPEHPDYLLPLKIESVKDPAAAAAEKDRAKHRVSYLQQKRQRERNRTNPIDEIAERYQEGPLSLLRHCYQHRAAVRVVTRHDRGVRGIATGSLVAFDKHMNLVLRDVEEEYTVLIMVERPTQSGGMRRCRKQEKRHRKLKQIFVAGNSVVSVSCHSALNLQQQSMLATQ